MSTYINPHVVVHRQPTWRNTVTTTSCTVLEVPAVINWIRKIRADRKLWEKCGGDYRLLHAMLIMMARNPRFDGTFKATRHDLKLNANINSTSLLEKAIGRLQDRGLLTVIDYGHGDVHRGDDRQRGRSGLYAIRFQGATSDRDSSHIVDLAGDPLFPSLMKKCAHSGSALIPDKHDHWDVQQPLLMFLGTTEVLEDDRVKDEPQILRLRHILGDEEPEINGTLLMNLLGIARSTAYEMVARWKEKGLIIHGRFVKLSRDLRTSDKFDRLRIVVKRERAIREEALAGRYVPSRFRKAQRAIYHQVGRFLSIDMDASSKVAEAQAWKADRGELPWLDPGELLALRGGYEVKLAYC